MDKKNSKLRINVQKTAINFDSQHEMVGVVFLLAALFVFLSLISFSSTDPVFSDFEHPSKNLMGYVGAQLANGLLSFLGMGSFVLVAALVYGGCIAFTRRGISFKTRKVIGYLALCVLGTIMCHLVCSGGHVMDRPPGGLVGEYAVALFTSLFSRIGTLVLVTAGMLLALIEVTGLSLTKTLAMTYKGLAALVRASGNLAYQFYSWLKSAFSIQPSKKDEKKPSPTRSAKKKIHLEEPEIVTAPSGIRAESGVRAREPSISSVNSGVGRREPLLVVDSDASSQKTDPEEGPNEARWSFGGIDRSQEPEIVLPKDNKTYTKQETDEPFVQPTLNYSNYKLPDLDLLNVKEQEETVIEESQLRKYARTLEQKLADYGVQGNVTKIMPGPVVTMYEYAPAPGIKVSKISGLSNDLALALGALSVRIIAPIPGRTVVGIEVANKIRQTVYSKEIIGDGRFQRSRSKLTLALGKDIEGSPYIADLNKMPHLLVAGATGTGKSVALNTMITSILFRATPEDVRFILVDPKVLELSLYQDIPHLLLPVVTDPRKALAALQWAVSEMDRRIRILHAAGVRSLDGYNKKVEIQNEKSASADTIHPDDNHRPNRIMITDKTVGNSVSETQLEDDDLESIGIDSQPALVEDLPEETKQNMQKLPHIVIVIDELADLMMSSSRDVETAIARIAQKARAAGIHLIIATQRPSVNVITGLIKANLPARISFRMASKTMGLYSSNYCLHS